MAATTAESAETDLHEADGPDGTDGPGGPDWRNGRTWTALNGTARPGLLGEGHAQHVEAAVDVDHLAGHGRRQVRGQVDGSPADILNGDVGPEGRDVRELPVQLL